MLRARVPSGSKHELIPRLQKAATQGASLTPPTLGRRKGVRSRLSDTIENGVCCTGQAFGAEDSLAWFYLYGD